MSENLGAPVVLGFDSSSSALAAADLAAQEALGLGVELRIVYAYVWPLFYASLAGIPFQPDEWTPAREVGAAVDALARRLEAAHPGLVARPVVRAGPGSVVLVDESARASLVVLGDHGVRGVAGLLAGPVAENVAAHAHCPVIVAPGRRHPATGRVVVGVDGTDSSANALMFACGWAEHRGAGIDAVYQVAGEPAESPAVQDRLASWIQPAARVHPDMDLRPLVVPERHAATALLALAETARMVVVGSRGRGAIAGATLGSVGHTLIHRAPCPVAVVHGTPPLRWSVPWRTDAVPA